jgi:hypothetical protein
VATVVVAVVTEVDMVITKETAGVVTREDSAKATVVVTAVVRVSGGQPLKCPFKYNFLFRKRTVHCELFIIMLIFLASVSLLFYNFFDRGVGCAWTGCCLCFVGGDWGGNQQFGSGYQNNFGGGVMKSGGYGQRGQGPYGGGK